MTIDVLQDIIARCHQRHAQPLKQRKTTVAPLLYKGLPYHFKVYCAHRYPMLLQDLEAACISFMPIGEAPDNDRPPRGFGGKRFSKRQEVTHWDVIRWQKSWGIHVYTGTPSARDGAPWHDIDFTYQAISAAPDAVLTCVQALVGAVVNPLLTLTKSGGLRFSCRIPGYLHPNTKQARLYVCSGASTAENPHQQDAYLEIFGEKGHNCWDARYEILLGNLLDPPVISKEVPFASIDTLRAKLHEPVPHSLPYKESIPDAPYSLGSDKLDLAKEAFFKRGFSYVRQVDGIHHWSRQGGADTEVSLWESEGNVWICASTPETELPMAATLITDVWKDTGILPPIPVTGLPIDDKVIAARETKLSPLGIKRPSPVLHKSEPTETVCETQEAISVQVQRAVDRGVRVVGLIPQTDTAANYEVESLLVNSAPNVGFGIAAEEFLQNRNVASVTPWRERMYLWDQVKDIPIEERMATPFEHGNVCEDPERCEALEKKGGNPSEIICPQCPVYTACQARGYLSQHSTLQTTQVQTLKDHRLFVDPQYGKIVEHLLEGQDGTSPLCIINVTRENQLFLECELSRTTLEEWIVNYQGSALGNFATILLNALEIRDKSHADAMKRLQSVIQMFEGLEDELIEQMCHVNVPGRVVARGTVAPDTGQALARFTIEFDRGVSAYIPLDAAAADRLAAEGLPFLRVHTFVVGENMKTPMSLSDAVRLDLLDASTVESISEFPTVCSDPNWTFWHQLKRFFAHYKRGADAPMRWEDEGIRFWVPPILHRSVRSVLVTSSALDGEHLRRTFLDTETEILASEPRAWVPGNRVFQIRTGIYPRKTILDHSNTWDVLGMSETGQRIFLGIQAEIERDPNTKHGIITHIQTIGQLKNIEKNENVRFLTSFRRIKGEGLETAFQEAEVIWIVGMPEARPRSISDRAQILFGNDEEPLSYEMDPDSYSYKDGRVQSVYGRTVAYIFTQIIELAQLDHLETNKKVMLLTGLRIPEITDRPETVLFDWEDFEVAGGLDKLFETIQTRQRFETERENLTAESSRQEVEAVLGCSTRQANRVLQKLRGGKIIRVPLGEQILSLLADGEKKTPELTAAIKGHPKAINTKLTRLVENGEIVKVRRGVYRLPEL